MGGSLASSGLGVYAAIYRFDAIDPHRLGVHGGDRRVDGSPLEHGARHRRRSVRRSFAARLSRPRADAPRGVAQLSDLRAFALLARGNAPGDAAIFLRERDRRAAVLAQSARHRLSARQNGAGQTPVRHAARRLRSGLRVVAPFDRAEGRRDRAVPRHGRRARLRAALFDFGVQYFGDEFRRSQRQRHSRAEQGRGARRLRP